MATPPPDAGSGGARPARVPGYKPHPSAGVKASPPAPLNALVLLQALRRRWLAGLLLGCLAGGLAFAAVWYGLPPPRFKAAAKLQMFADPQGILFDHPEGKKDFQTFQQTQLGLLKGRGMLEAVLRQPQVARLEAVRAQPNPVEWLEGEIAIDFPSGSEIVRLSVQGDDPETPKVLADAVTSVYLAEVKKATTGLREKRIAQLRALVGEFMDKVKNLHEEVKKKAEPAGANDKQLLTFMQRVAQERIQLLQRLMAESEILLTAWKNEEALLKARPDKAEVNPRAVEELVDANPELTPLINQIKELSATIDKDKEHAKDGGKHPAVQSQIQKLDRLKDSLEEKRKKLRVEAEARLREQAVLAARSRLLELQDRIREAESLNQRRMEDVERLEKDLKMFNKVALELDEHKLEIGVAENIAAKAWQEVEVLRAEHQDPLRVELLEEAVVSRPNEVERKLKVAGAAAAGAAGLTLLLVAFLEFRARRVASADEVTELGLRLVGTVPARAGPAAGISEADWQSLLAESVDSARTMLLHASGSGRLRLVLITSAVGGEGKTSLAGHLAASLARSGRKTLLLDADLRHPSVHRLFEIPEAPGFAEALRGDVAPADAVRPTGLANLHVLPAGRCDYAALAQLNGPALPRALNDLKERYEFVLVDCSPVLHVADTLLIAPHMDGVLLAVLQGVSCLPNVYAALQRLAALDINLLGAVLNGTRERVSDYGRLRYLARLKST
jgi:capsular exopolysaccharide synthesis family protein